MPSANPSGIPFVKMHGLGNDYVFIDEHEVSVVDAEHWAVVLSDRHRGIGSDGLIILRRDLEFGIGMEMRNADGGRAEMCGNGIRCLARLAYDRGYVTTSKFTIQTEAGPRGITLSERGSRAWIGVAMGPARIEREPITFETEAGAQTGYRVDLGNPHFVIPQPDSLEPFPVSACGPEIERHFPGGMNIEFTHNRNSSAIDLRVWERGSGETQACGTGATAAAALLHELSEVGQKVRVSLLGGDLEIDATSSDDIVMWGPAEYSFRGEFDLGLVD